MYLYGIMLRVVLVSPLNEEKVLLRVRRAHLE